MLDIERINELLKARDPRLSAKIDPSDDPGTDDTLDFYMDDVKTDVHMQLGYGYYYSHREVQEPVWAMLHLTPYDGKDYTFEEALDHAVKELQTDERKTEYQTRGE